MSGYNEKVQVLAWDSQSEDLVIASGNMISVWSFSGAGPKNTDPIDLQLHAEAVTLARFAPRDKVLVSTDKAGLLCFWRILKDDPQLLGIALNKSPIHAAFYYPQVRKRLKSLVSEDLLRSMISAT